MKIGVFFQHLPPFPGAGSLRAASVIGALRKRAQSGTRIEVCTTEAGPEAESDGVHIHVLDDAHVDNAHGLVSRIFGELLMGWRAGKHLASTRPDILVISSPAYLSALMVAWRARRGRIPYVLEIRDVYPQVYAHAGLLKIGSLPYRWLISASRYFYRGALAIVTATRGLAEAIRPDAGDIPVRCIYNGFPAELASLRVAKHERFTVCFHGVLGFFQDVPTLIAVARALQAHDVDVVVIGYGRQEASLVAAALPNLRFLGKLAFEDTVAEVARCHVGLCLRRDDPISRDAFPVKVWEYIALGLPQLVTPPCEAGEFVERHGCGSQFASGNVSTLVSGIRELKDHPDELALQVLRCEAAGRGFTRDVLGLDIADVVLALAKELETAP